MLVKVRKQVPVVLMVDDNPDDIMFVERALQGSNIDVQFHSVTDGAFLVDCLHGRGRFSGEVPVRPDVILLDLKMPLVDGLTAISQVKGHDDLRMIPIVMMTTSDLETDVTRAYSAGAASFITKPQSFDQLVSVVQRLRDYWFETVQLPA
jgi:CheY-like chemotaxis protein